MISAWLMNLLVGYFVVSNVIFLILLMASFVAIRRMVFSRPMIESIWKRTAELGPPITLIAPSFNEEKSIVSSVKSFLGLDYPRHEVIVVNDGSTDQSMLKLQEEFKLKPARIFYDDSLSKSKIHGVFRSQIYDNLIVIDKENGGKADAINVGIGFSNHEIFCAVDADCYLDRDALLKVTLPFVENPETTVAAGGTVRPLNGSVLRVGKPPITRLPKNPIVLFQIVEYLRAFLFGRVGWNELNATMIISGAFGIFKKAPVVAIGGYRQTSIGEDMELVLHLRRWGAENQREVDIAFIADPICWTEVPSDLFSLGRQRDRWQRGLADSLFQHSRMFFNRKYGMAGLVAYPAFFFFELLQPLISLLAYVLMIVGLSSGWIRSDVVVLFFVVEILFGMMMSFGAVLIEDSAFHKYPKVGQLGVLLVISLVENLGFRQLTTFWRVIGTFKYIMGDSSWGKMQRSGFSYPNVNRPERRSK